MKEILKPFGPLKAFTLIMDRSTGNSKVRNSCLHPHFLPGKEFSWGIS